MYLRQPQPSDFAELEGLYKSSREHFRGRAEAEFSVESFRRSLGEADPESNESFLVCLAADETIAGTITLSQIFRKAFQNAYLGYQLFAGFTGHGYMSEAVELVLRYAFSDLKLHRVEANVQPGNKPSIHVLERNGFTKEGFSRRYIKISGRWRDHERWAIIRDDWIKKKTNDRSRIA